MVVLGESSVLGIYLVPLSGDPYINVLLGHGLCQWICTWWDNHYTILCIAFDALYIDMTHIKCIHMCSHTLVHTCIHKHTACVESCRNWIPNLCTEPWISGHGNCKKVPWTMS